MNHRPFLNKFHSVNHFILRSKCKSSLKNFQDIPGPMSLPVIGSMWKYVWPHKDRYDPERLHLASDQKYRKYGPLVRETLPGGGGGLLSVFDPEDIKDFLRQTMSRPDRRSHLALKKYRTDRPHMYASGGLLPSNGEEWFKLRRASQTVFGRKEAVLGHLQDTDEITEEFLNLVRRTRDQNGEIEDLLSLITKMNTEVIVSTLFNHRMGCLSDSPTSEGLSLMKAGGLSTQAIFKTDNGPLQLYRHFNTPLYRQLVESQDYIYSVAKKYYNIKKQTLSSDTKKKSFDKLSKTPILEYLIRHSGLGEREVLGVVADALMAGVDTTSFSLSFALYHISRNEEVQEKLHMEARQLMEPTGGKVTEEVLAGAKYTVATMKESFRLNPISIGIGRVNTTKSIVLRGYHIPPGTTLVSMNQHIGRNALYFDRPEEFRPERFFCPTHHSHALLPFGQGARMCIAHNLAKQGLYVALLKMAYNFKLEWLSASHLDCRVHLINEPDAPLHFRVTDW